MPLSMQAARHSQIRIRRIDADKNVRPLRQEHAFDAREEFGEPGQIAQHVEQTHDRQGFGRLPALASRGLHFGSGHTEKFGVRRAPAQGMNQVGTQRIA